jgi:multidrug transporter EmrE-like cation transporter
VGLIVVASCVFATAGALMKSSQGFAANWSSVGVVVLFAAGAVLLARAVHREGLATAWVVGLGLEAAITTGLGLWLYSERLSMFQLAGVVLIVGGTAVVRLS